MRNLLWPAGSRASAWWRTVVVAAALLLALAGPASAQEVVGGSEELDFDRPEAWAMKYFSSATFLTGLGPPTVREAGSLEMAFELGWIPHLDEDQRRVGFNGTKVEDLNKLPVLGRPRLTVGLGRSWSLDLSWVPPIEISGLKANLLAVGVERPLVEAGRWTLGLRAYGQIGKVEGDFTCPAHEAALEPGSPGNEFGCEEPSNDEVSLDHFGLAVTGGYRLGSRSDLHFGVSANYLDMEFQVDALTYGVLDRTRLLADGWAYSLNTGVSRALGDRITVGAELFYAPLDVRRSADAAVDNDSLLNVRAIVRYTLR